MTPRERIRAALLGRPVDHIPVCIYQELLPRGETERRLRNEGIGIYHTWIPVVHTERPNTTVTTTNYKENGRWWIRNTISTPVGEVNEVLRTGGAYHTNLRCEFFIKKPTDYKVVEFMFKDETYFPCPEIFNEADRNMGEDGLVVGAIDCTPMQNMLIFLMGPERFAIDYYEHQEEFFSLYEVMCRQQDKQYEIAADSPAEFIEFGDNITAEMIGLERFQKYVVPCYNRFAEILHVKGKRLGSHMDGKLKILKEAIGNCNLDFIEAFTPPPDGDLSIREARECWGKKVISLNFTSSVHLRPPAKIKEHTLQLLRDSFPGTGFIMGITENIPENVWQKSLTVISRTVQDWGPVPKNKS